MVEKLSDSEKLVLRLQSDLQFVLKDKASLFYSQQFLWSGHHGLSSRKPDMLVCTCFSLSAGASEHGTPGPGRAVHSHLE